MANVPKQRQLARALRRLFVIAALVVGLGTASGYLIRTALGAVVIEYFNAISSSSAVLLEWSTNGEYNVAGYELQCKLAGEPAAAYHRIAFLNAKGGPDQRVAYDYLVTNLQPGTAYCFRLKEITTDQEPGETREVCGYGLSITPTPVQSVTPTAPLTPTVALFPTPTLFPGQPTPIPGFTPTIDPFAPQSNLPTPTVDPFQAQFQPTIDPFAPTATPTYDPFLPPTPTIDYFATAAAAPTPMGAVPDPLAAGLNPPLDPALAAMQDPALLAQQAVPTIDPAFQPQSPLDAPIGGLTDVPVNPVTEAGTDMGVATPDPALFPPSVPPTPTALYIIVTAAPTEVLAAVPPVVTPWPSATPAVGLQLAGLAQPTAQNLTVMLLCFIFVSASGLGALGLITSILYMRSRTRRDEELIRLRARRRA